MMKHLFLLSILLIPVFSFSQLTEEETTFLRQELSQRINQLRVSKKLKPLIFNDTLRKSAQFHSEYMAEKGVLTHNQKQSKFANPQKRVFAFGGTNFEIVGENVLFSTKQNFPITRHDLISLAEEMFQTWKNSKPHYANLINKHYRYGDFGFAVDVKKGNVYAVQVFGTKAD